MWHPWRNKELRAEILSVILFSQFVSSGCPHVYGKRLFVYVSAFLETEQQKSWSHFCSFAWMEFCFYSNPFWKFINIYYFFLFMRQNCLLKLTTMVPSPSYESRVAKTQCLSLPPFPLGMAELGQVLLVWLRLAAQSSPRCSPHLCMPKTRWQTAFWWHEMCHGCVSNCMAGRGSWCPGETWQFYQHKTCLIFIYMSLSWERMREYKWQKCHD